MQVTFLLLSSFNLGVWGGDFLFIFSDWHSTVRYLPTLHKISSLYIESSQKIEFFIFLFLFLVFLVRVGGGGGRKSGLGIKIKIISRSFFQSGTPKGKKHKNQPLTRKGR